MKYIRKGICLQCGICCLNEDCEYLLWKVKKAICLIHNRPEYPDKCKLHPQSSPIMIEECGYYFINITENRKLGVHEV